MLNMNDIIIFEYDNDISLNSMKFAIQYAIFSIPFTFNRMEFNLNTRIKNIIKGKYAEQIFFNFLKNNKIHYKDTQTPYYMLDDYDFEFKNYKWDIKNNYIFCDYLQKDDILHFYGLIPNRSIYDQWNKFISKKNVCTLFTFMHLFDFEITINDNIQKILKYYVNKYKGKSINFRPIDFENDIVKYFNTIMFKYLDLKKKMYITGFVCNNNLDKFFDLNPNFIFLTKNNIRCFQTKIHNKAVLIHNTLSFKKFIANSTNLEV